MTSGRVPPTDKALKELNHNPVAPALGICVTGRSGAIVTHNSTHPQAGQAIQQTTMVDGRNSNQRSRKPTGTHQACLGNSTEVPKAFLSMEGWGKNKRGGKNPSQCGLHPRSSSLTACFNKHNSQHTLLQKDLIMICDSCK